MLCVARPATGLAPLQLGDGGMPGIRRGTPAGFAHSAQVLPAQRRIALQRRPGQRRLDRQALGSQAVQPAEAAIGRQPGVGRQAGTGDDQDALGVLDGLGDLQGIAVHTCPRSSNERWLKSLHRHGKNQPLSPRPSPVDGRGGKRLLRPVRASRLPYQSEHHRQRQRQATLRVPLVEGGLHQGQVLLAGWRLR